MTVILLVILTKQRAGLEMRVYAGAMGGGRICSVEICKAMPG